MAQDKLFRVRVDGLMDEDIVKFLDTYSNRYLLVHHETKSENPHYHAYVETKMSQPNFSKYIKQHLKVKGTDYSNKLCDPARTQEFLSYLFNKKNGNVSRYVNSKNFVEPDVLLARSQAEQIELEYKKRRATNKQSQFDLVLTAIANLKEERRLVNPVNVYDELVSLCLQAKKVMRTNHIRDMIMSALAYSGEKESADYARQKVLKYFDPLET